MSNFSLLGKGGEKNDCLFQLPDRPIGIGTNPDQCTIIYTQAQNVAGFHCQLVPSPNGWTLTDYSTNGTWINGKKMNPFQAYPLKHGDVFYLASLENSFYFSDNSATNFNQGQTQPPQWTPQNQGQFQSPQSTLDTIKEKFFNYKGRLNREPYILRLLCLLGVNLLIGGVYNISFDLESTLKEATSIEEFTGIFLKYMLIGFVIYLPTTISACMLMIRRLHDLNKSERWVSISVTWKIFTYIGLYELIKISVQNNLDDYRTIAGLMIIAWGILSIILIIFVIYLIFKKGTKGYNNYGSDPLI